MRMPSLCLFPMLLAPIAIEANPARLLEKETVIESPIGAVWHAWTSEDGLAYISAESNVELRVGGAYEWFLDGPADERGLRGGQGSKVLAWLPKEMIAFSWTFPPAVPALRNAGETTQVVVLLDDLGDGRVRVRLAAHGWQEGPDWRKGYEYFDAAWGYVLEALKEHLESKDGNGPG